MTYARRPATFAAAMTEALKAGQDWLAERLGVSASRLRQCANPSTNYLNVLELVCAADIACAERGIGTPVFNEYRRRLVAAGALTLSCPERRAHHLARAARAAAVALRSIADALFAAVGQEPQVEGAAA
jgi:hypothetical protein